MLVYVCLFVCMCVCVCNSLYYVLYKFINNHTYENRYKCDNDGDSTMSYILCPYS